MDFVKHVVLPIRQVAQRTSLRGFVEDYHHVDADVVVLAGETHLYRKPVSTLVLPVGLNFHDLSRVKCALPLNRRESGSRTWWCIMLSP